MMTAREFTFKGDIIKDRPVEYKVTWHDHSYFANDSRVTISKEKGFSGVTGSIELLGSDLPKFIKELQTLVEFMKNDGLLTEEDQDEQ